MMKKIAVLGSTGSIGTQTLEVVRYNKDIQVTALAAGGNVKLMEEQIREFKPGLACLWDEEKAKELRAAVADLDVKVASGMEGLMEAATSPEADLVVTAVVGMIGIRPAIAAMEAGKDIALANKETLVTAGHIIMPLAREKGVKLLPVDSEHSAIFQCLQGAAGNPLHKILLTASGGPFRGFTREQLKQVRLEDALKHPNWSMGHKITIDSSTMVNKGLEVMEARWLFGVEMDQVQVVVQPASIIHSMVEFEDGAVIAQLGTPDMKLPIQVALGYPNRLHQGPEAVDLVTLGSLHFESPDTERFPCLALAYEAGRQGGMSPIAFNAANEIAVQRYREHRIGFYDIPRLIEKAMSEFTGGKEPNLDEILQIDKQVRQFMEAI